MSTSAPDATKKNKGGQPPKYKSADALAVMIGLYFESCFERKTKGKGKKKVVYAYRIAMPNKAGLCHFLKISRETYSQYKKKYPDTLKEAEFYIENEWVQRLGGNSPTGAIFYLKNAFKEEYKDRQEVAHHKLAAEDLKEYQ